MASAIPPVLVELQLETANIKAQMQQLNKNFTEFGETVKRQTGPLQNFKTAALGVFGGNILMQGLNMFSAGIRDTMKDAAEFERVTAQLAAGIKSTGNVAGLSVEGLKAHASQLESISAVDENLIMQSQAVFQTFTNVRNVVGEGNDVFNQASAAALDLSVKMKGDLQGATLQLGKALNDPIKGVGRLTRVGVVFTDAQKAQIKTLVESGNVMGAQKVILAEMSTEFGGAAKAAGDTFAGAVFRAKDKVQDFGRSIVLGLQPILLNIGKTIGALYTTYLAPLLKIIIDNKEALLLFVGVLGAAYAAFRLYGVILGVVKSAQTLYAVAQVLMSGGQLASIASTNGLAASMLRLNAVMRANPVGLIVTGIALLAAGFIVAYNNSETFRKIVVKGLQIVLNAVGYLIGGLASMINLFAKIPGMGWAKGIADGAAKAANDIRKVSDGLDGLANKKITLPGFGGGSKTGSADTFGDAPSGGKTTSAIAAAKKAANQIIQDIAKANESVASSYKEMNKVISEARAKSVQIEKAYNIEIVDINKKYAAKSLEIAKQYADKALTLEVEADVKRASIIQKSKDLLISAFRSATKLDLSDLMKDSDQTGASMITRLREKYRLITELQAKAGALASKGFSQTFIQDIISQGPLAGSAMADAILNSSPDAISEIKALYNKVQDVSEYGMTKLADQMYEGMGFATNELAKEYSQIAVDLQKALLENSSALTEALASNQKTLQDTLLAAQNSYNDAIDKLEKDTLDKLTSLQDKLKETAETLRKLSGANAAISTMANAPAAPILAGTSQLGLAQKAGTVINNTTNVSGVNLADPQATANTVSNAMRFGSGQSLTPKSNFTYNSGNPLAGIK